MHDDIRQLKQQAYRQATNENLPDSVRIEAMKALALLTIAEMKQQ